MTIKKVVFVYLGDKFPKYAKASLELAHQFSGLDVTLLGNAALRNQVDNPNVEFIPIEEFYNQKNFMEIASKINFSIAFRNGFWSKTLERFYVLKQYMEFFSVQEIFHAELDQLLFRCDKLLESLENSHFKGVALPFHTIDVGVASVFYCNDLKSLESMLDFSKSLDDFDNEMELIAQWAKSNPSMLKLLPTMASEVKETDLFKRSGLEIIPPATIGGIVDASQIGQWLGGQDPRNLSIRESPKNKFVSPPSEEILSLSDLRNIDLKLTAEGSLQISHKDFNAYDIFNIHLHSKIHPWIEKSVINLNRLIDSANESEPIVFSASRRIQIANFVTTGFKSVTLHPISFIKRYFASIVRSLKKHML